MNRLSTVPSKLNDVYIIKDTLSLITFDTRNQGTWNSQINTFSLNRGSKLYGSVKM